MQQRKAEQQRYKQNRIDVRSRYSYTADISKHPKEVKKISCKTIYSINFSDDALMITSKYGLVIYSLLTLKQIYSIEGEVWEAAFIPETNYIIYVIKDPQHQTKNIAIILDLVSNKIVTKISVKFFIEYIKTGINTIALASLQNLSILSFPNLKPIYLSEAGNGLRIVFDVSLRGLIFAHDTSQKGQLVIHNLTGPHSIIKQRNNTLSQIWTQKSRSKRENMFSQKDQKRKFTIRQVFSSEEEIKIIKMSPNGGRAAVTGVKGSSIKVFSTLSGKKLQQMSVSYQVCKIYDLAFDEQGLFLACLAQGMKIYVFNCKIDEYDEIFYKKKYKSHVFQQSNPSSSFWLLSPFYSPFGNDQPFSDFTLEPPQDKKSNKNEKKMQQKDPIMTILEDPQANPIEIQLLKRNLQANDLLDPLSYQNEGSKQKSSSLRQSSLPVNLLKQKRSTLIYEEVKQQFIPTVYNTVNKIHIGSNAQVWAIRGYFLYAAQYDRFNGGVMEHSHTMVIQ